MLAKNSLTLAKQGYELMDKKRNILIRELMDLIDEARDIQDEIDSTFTYAYQCLQRANIEHGINMVSQIAYTVPIENSITIQTRSIMRANALQNITIPMYTELVYNITNALEEKEREEFTRLKVIKRMKQKKSGG